MGDALAEWAELPGVTVVTEPAEMARRSRTTLVAAPAPLAAVVPTQRAQIADIVRIAATHRVPVYPVSCGRNWGWGDACPPTEGQVVLDLSRLTGVELDEELGVATVEPGVTQGLLAERLAGTDWVPDCTTAGPSTSVVGNMAERGIGQSPLAERWGCVLSIEAVLADGSVVRTGFGRFPGARAARSYRWGLGPNLDGLFSQSNLGVIAAATIILQPRPQVVRAYCQTVPDANLEAFFDTQRRLRLAGVPMGAPHVFPMADRWLIVTGLSGIASIVVAGEGEVMEHLAPLGAVALYSRDDLAQGYEPLLARAGLPDNVITREFLDAAVAFTSGEPMQLSPAFVLNYAGGAAQRRTEPPLHVDPLDEGYGFQFAWPMGTSRGSDVRALAELVKRVLGKYERPLLFTLSCPNARTVAAVTRVAFYKGDPADEAAGQACYDELLDAAYAAGFPPARASIAAMDRLDPYDSVHTEVTRRIKGLLDPDGILAPGRYT